MRCSDTVGATENGTNRVRRSSAEGIGVSAESRVVMHDQPLQRVRVAPSGQLDLFSLLSLVHAGYLARRL